MKAQAPAIVGGASIGGGVELVTFLYEWMQSGVLPAEMNAAAAATIAGLGTGLLIYLAGWVPRNPLGDGPLPGPNGKSNED